MLVCLETGDGIMNLLDGFGVLSVNYELCRYFIDPNY